MDKSIQVFLAEDHRLVREGLKRVLRDVPGLTVAGEADLAMETIQGLRRVATDVLLLDISLPDKSGIELIRELKTEHPRLAILMLTMHREDQYAIRALKAGAAGYMNKQVASSELVNAIFTVAAGRKYISAALAQELARHLADESSALPHEGLSEREYQTMTMIASGKSVTDIAQELSLSVKTVSMYRSRLLEKMNMRHNAELTHYAIRNGLVE
jgi:two-component system invasion response regulator UvrY